MQLTQYPTSMARFLEIAPLPSHLAHLRPILARLPVQFLVNMIPIWGSFALPEEAIQASLHDAVAFQDQGSWRCPACLRWQNAPNLTLTIVADGRIEFYMLCPDCERRYPSTDAQRTAIQSYRMGGQ